MIFKGTSKLKGGEFDKRIEALGGSSNAATGLDDSHYYVLVPPDGVSTAIDLLINLVSSPSFDETQEMYFAIGQGASNGNKGGFSNSWYWTSSQANEEIAWSFSFSNGTTFNFFKTSAFLVRPIRSF